MNIAKIKRDLRREFARDPKKTMVLVGLIPLAIYFIAPLLTGKKETEGKRRALVVESTPQISLPTPASVSRVKANGGSVGWRQQFELLRTDSRMQPANLRVASRNPFAFPPDPAKALAETTVDDDELENVLSPTLSLDGFVLTATLSGSRLRLATISGRTYRENQYLRSSNEDGAELLPWRLAQVARNHVILQHDGQPYILRLKANDALLNGITIHHNAR